MDGVQIKAWLEMDGLVDVSLGNNTCCASRRASVVGNSITPLYPEFHRFLVTSYDRRDENLYDGNVGGNIRLKDNYLNHLRRFTLSENFALYSSRYDSLPFEQMDALVLPIKPQKKQTASGITYIYKWEDNLQIKCSTMPKEQLVGHLNGFCSYIKKIGFNSLDKTNQLLEVIKQTTLAVSIEIIPARDKQGRAENIVGSLCYGLKPIVFHEGAIFNYNSELLFAPNGMPGAGKII